MLHERVDSDLELIHLAKQGDSASFGLLLERFRPRLYAAALGMLRDIHSANDAVQDTFVLALTRLQTLRDPAAFTGWLFAILRNVCRGYLRASANQIELGDELPESQFDDYSSSSHIEQTVEHALLRESMFGALAKLSEPLRAVTMLRYLSSVTSYESIAVILGIPVGTVRSRLSQARAELLGQFLRTSGESHDHSLQIERREQYLYWLGRFYLGDRDRFFARFVQDVGYTLQGKWRTKDDLIQEFDSDVEAGSILHPYHFIVSGSVTIAEARIINSPETPFRCPPLAVEVSVHRGDKIVQVHHYVSDEIPSG